MLILIIVFQVSQRIEEHKKILQILDITISLSKSFISRICHLTDLDIYDFGDSLDVTNTSKHSLID